MSTMPYGNEWKKRRALFHQHFNPNDLHMIQPVIQTETNVLLRNLLENSGNNLFHNVRRYGTFARTAIVFHCAGLTLPYIDPLLRS